MIALSSTSQARKGRYDDGKEGGGDLNSGEMQANSGKYLGGLFDMQPTNHARSGVNPGFGAES